MTEEKAPWLRLLDGDDKEAPRREAAPRVTPTLPPGTGTRRARAALTDEVSILSAATEGTRNHQLNTSGYNLFQLVHGGALPYDDAYNALHTVALGIGLTESETIDTLRSAWRAAASSPRDAPDDELPQLPELSTLDRPTEEGEEPPTPPSIGDRFPVLDFHELWADESEEEWIVYPLLPARRLVALFSPPKVGKSLLMLELAVAIAAGTEVLGFTPEPRTVLYVDFENDPRGDVRTRLQAMGKTPHDLDNLKYLSYPQLAYLDTYIGGLELLSIAEHYGAEVVVIDTISRAVKGEENDNDTWLGFYRHTGLTLKAAGKAVIRLDHTGKDVAKGMRGGSAKYGDVDAVWSMTKITDTTLQLECTANRLPIGEKQITVDRVYEPHLRHKVNAAGAYAAIEAQVPAVLAIFKAAGFPREGTGGRNGGGGEKKALELVAGRGFSRGAVRKAIGLWREGHSEQTALWSAPTVFKDD